MAWAGILQHCVKTALSPKRMIRDKRFQLEKKIIYIPSDLSKSTPVKQHAKVSSLRSWKRMGLFSVGAVGGSKFDMLRKRLWVLGSICIVFAPYSVLIVST
jgi:hypothetical protein